MRRLLISMLFLGLAAAGAHAAGTLADAKELYNNGKYDEALEILQALRSKTPRDGNINYYLGATQLKLGWVEEAQTSLKTARERGVADATRLLAEVAADEYLIDDARELLDSYETQARKQKKAIDADQIGDMRERLALMENMLERVENIQVIDSLIVDADRFFARYPLSSDCGALVGGEVVGMPDVEVAFIPASHTEILYSQLDSTGVFSLYTADILDDGHVEHPVPMGGDLGGGGNAEYPFLHTDGETIYFAADGEGSLGGYDIFLTRRGENGYLQPQNIGMPFNSPDDDYLLVIDDTKGIGWWATDRNHIPGKVTIYTFIPNEVRENVPTDDPNLIAKARLSDISLTQNPDIDYEAVRRGIEEAAKRNYKSVATDDFALSLGNGTIYHRFSDFRSADAMHLMGKVIDTRAEIEKIEQRLEFLRSAYAKGDKGAAGEIMQLEGELARMRGQERSLTNRVISLETAR